MVVASRCEFPEHCPECLRRHRSWRAFARCFLPGAIWIHGAGPWASVSFCRGVTTVQLYRKLEDAEKAKRLINELGCGGCCQGAAGHVVVNVLERARERWPMGNED